MLYLRKSEDRGGADHGWLKAKHTFSFGDYRDPEFMGFRTLRVINQDIVAGGGGFPPHPHRDMEIITYLLRGTIAHKDSMGHERQLGRGEIQVMTAGRGVTHSEFNASPKEALELLQIWIVPAKTGLPPAYGQMALDETKLRQGLTLLVSSDGADGSLKINQDARVYATKLAKDQTVAHALGKERHVWVQLVSGGLIVDDGAETMRPGDGLAASEQPTLKLRATADDTELLLFDLT